MDEEVGVFFFFFFFFGHGEGLITDGCGWLGLIRGEEWGLRRFLAFRQRGWGFRGKGLLRRVRVWRKRERVLYENGKGGKREREGFLGVLIAAVLSASCLRIRIAREKVRLIIDCPRSPSVSGNQPGWTEERLGFSFWCWGREVCDSS